MQVDCTFFVVLAGKWLQITWPSQTSRQGVTFAPIMTIDMPTICLKLAHLKLKTNSIKIGSNQLLPSFQKIQKLNFNPVNTSQNPLRFRHSPRPSFFELQKHDFISLSTNGLQALDFLEISPFSSL
jgi:hypothetical protein